MNTEQFFAFSLTIFDLGDVSHHQLSHGNLDLLPIADDSEFLFLFYAALQTSELLLLAPVVECCDQHYADH